MVVLFLMSLGVFGYCLVYSFTIAYGCITFSALRTSTAGESVCVPVAFQPPFLFPFQTPCSWGLRTLHYGLVFGCMHGSALFAWLSSSSASVW